MVKKIFVLASVTALTGLIATVGSAGCSSTVTAVNDLPETGASSGGPGDSGRPAVDSAVDEGDTSMPPGMCPTTDPIAAADIEMQFKWVPPAAIQAVCTQKNLDDLKALFVTGGGSAKFTDMKTTLGATCAACAFTADTAANWGPLVENTAGVLENEDGSCFAQVDTGTSACGKAAFEFEICLQAACPSADCTDQATCTAAAAKGACKGLNATVTTACPDITKDVAICGGIVDSISVNCGGWTPDAGLDSSVQ